LAELRRGTIRLMLVNVERLRHRAAAPALTADPAPAREIVSLLVPLLNDGHRVTRCALALMRQIRIPRLDIVFLDAGSTDLTRQLLLHAADDDPRVRLLIGAPTPPGWCAYAHACEQLAVAARGKSYVFADPGLALAPGAVAAAVAALRGTGGSAPERYDLVVAEARQRTRPNAAPDPAAPPLSTTARLLAVDAAAYWRVGGHCNAAHDTIGEAGLIRAVQLSGGRALRADGRHAIEFLDGSAWPGERAGVTVPAPARLRSAMSDTENSILHSFTDTARRLLAALALTPPAPQLAPLRAPARALTHRGNSRAGQLHSGRRRELASAERLALPRVGSPGGRD
jgi:hypothetical protein